MPAIGRKFRGVALAAALLLLAGSAPAWADIVPGGDSGSEGEVGGGSGDDGTINASAGAVVYDHSENGSGQAAGPVVSATDWTPPACYYAPALGPDELKAELEPIWEAESTGPEWDAAQRDRYVNGNPYKDFNKEKEGEGYWWDGFIPDGRIGDPGALDCQEPYFWVDTDDDPPADIPQAITPEMLAQLAYAELRVPSTEVSLAPEVETKVNLPTWAWLDGATFKPVSVTASVLLLGMEATTTAEPVSLRIEPGTADAELHPGSGECAITDGRIGEPYAKGKADRTPPCGVTYLRSSGDGTFQLQATITWKIHWTGTGVAKEQPLPDGTFGADQAVTVQEIQAINR
ncbi:hypothetical protein ACFWMQ_05060 [Streptomyces sp. NPDC058372]|uniref:hypothetical protein n=1 Tax=Streptomyces sp. NPDC058372 TaxID=3346464 RepID=UPI0036621EBA